MHRHRATLSGPGTFFAGPCWVDYIICMSGFDLRQAQPLLPAIPIVGRATEFLSNWRRSFSWSGLLGERNDHEHFGLLPSKTAHLMRCLAGKIEAVPFFHHD